MKVTINKDEWYPVYFIHTDSPALDLLPTFDISDKLYRNWKSSKREFDLVQAALAIIYEAKS